MDEIDIADTPADCLAQHQVGQYQRRARLSHAPLVPRIREFQDRYPNIELRLSALSDRVDFQRSDTDMAIYFGRGEWKDLSVRFFRECPWSRYAAQGWNGRKPLNSPEDLHVIPTLLRVSSRPDEWKQILDKAGIARATMNKIMTFPALIGADGSHGRAGLRCHRLQTGGARTGYGQLKVPLDLRLDTENGFYLVYPCDRQLTYGMKAFRDWIVADYGRTGTCGSSGQS